MTAFLVLVGLFAFFAGFHFYVEGRWKPALVWFSVLAVCVWFFDQGAQP